MTPEQFEQFISEDIPSALFHISPTDLDDNLRVRCDELILLRMLNDNPTALQHRPLYWFVINFLC
jgi:hypothetical protein